MFQFHPDVAVRKEVDKLVVKCALHEQGCPWQGSLKDHEVVIYYLFLILWLYMYVQSNHKLSCAVTCKDCGEIVPSAVLDNHLQEWCSNKQVNCSDCNEEMRRTQLEVCTNTPTNFPTVILGRGRWF